MTNVFVKCKIQQIGNVITNSNYPPVRSGFSIDIFTFRSEPISEVLCVQWTLTVTSKCHVYFRLACTPPSERRGGLQILSWFPLEK